MRKNADPSALVDANETLLLKAIDELRAELLRRFDRIEQELDRRASKEAVDLIVSGIRESLCSHAADLKALGEQMGKKVDAETLWRIISLSVAAASVAVGFVTFVINLLMRHAG